jgi:hypothetical protein
MAEFHWVPSGTYSPTKCVFCGDHQGPFIDAHLDLDAYGHVYVCASTLDRPGCTQQIARLDGMVTINEVDELVTQLGERVNQLETELEEALGNRTVPLSDVLEMLNPKKQEVRSGKE